MFSVMFGALITPAFLVCFCLKTQSRAAEMPEELSSEQKEQYSPGLSSRVEWNVTQMKNGSDIQPEDSFLTLPFFFLAQ